MIKWLLLLAAIAVAVVGWEPARAYILLTTPGSGGVPCGATSAIYDTACNAILSGDVEMPL